MTRLSDDTVLKLRERAAAGEEVCDLAAEFGISRGYAYKVVAGEARTGAGSPSAGDSRLADALEEYVDTLAGLEGRQAVLAQLALDLARRLDACPPGSAAGAAAAARVAGMLNELLADLAPGESTSAEQAAARLLKGLMAR